MGVTPLYAAGESGHIEVVRFLRNAWQKNWMLEVCRTIVEACFCAHVDLFDDLPQSIYYSHASRSEWTFPCSISDQFWWWKFDCDFWAGFTFILKWHFGNADYTRDTWNPKLRFGVKMYQNVMFIKAVTVFWQKTSMFSLYFGIMFSHSMF